jgi:hypothetical protein
MRMCRGLQRSIFTKEIEEGLLKLEGSFDDD